MKSLKYYHCFASLLAYPGGDVLTQLNNLKEIVSEEWPSALEDTDFLIRAFSGMNVLQQQEYYLKTFDVHAICYLDIGYVLFGEDYKRAQLLVNLQTEHRKAGVDCGTELADHLPNILKLLAETKDPAFANELGFVLLVPAIRFMLMKFNGTDNYYKSLLEMLLAFLRQDFKGEALAEYAIPEHYYKTESAFLMPSPNRAICDTLCNQRKKI